MSTTTAIYARIIRCSNTAQQTVKGIVNTKAAESSVRTVRTCRKCTASKEHVKVVTRHIWEPYMEKAEDIRYTLGMKELYQQRKQTIERIFGTAKENHGFRYTQQYGKARMEMKVGLTYACMNLKKLGRILERRGLFPLIPFHLFVLSYLFL